MEGGETAGAATAFEALGERVRDTLRERGFERPTEPQRGAIPAIADGDDALVVAPTGTGKTETAMLPVLDALCGSERFGIGALYVTPLRALNRDMRERLEWWGDRLGLDVAVRHGDTSDYQRRRQADDPPDVLVTTPETLQAMLTGSKLRRALSDVAHVVVDEIHELAAAKRGAQLAIGLERLRALAGPVQRIGLSATVGDPAEVGRFLTGDRGCSVVEVDPGAELDVTVVSPSVGPEDKRLAAELATDATTASHVRRIREIVAANESTLIFVNTRQTAEALGAWFGRLDEPIAVHHGSLSAEARLDAEERFKSGDIAGLVCTSSMELGIDVGRVDHVVQYASPREVARLLQRVGRAGHREDRVSSGTVVTTGPDDTLEAAVIARRALDGEVETTAIHEGSLDVVANQIAGMVLGRDGVSARAVYDLVTAAAPFADLDEATVRAVIRELDGNGVVWLDEEEDRLEPSGGTWRYVYSNLSMIPDERTYGVHDVSAGRRVGTLDERFVLTFAEPGATFVQGGELWRVDRVDDDEERVEVAPVSDPGGEVPSWIGQEIPVPRPVASEVGELRRVAAGQLTEGGDRAAVGADLAARYPATDGALADALARLGGQVDDGQPVPTDDRIVVEKRGRTGVVNVAAGHAVNETLTRLLAALLGQQTGSSVGFDIDPYRIELEVPSGVGPAEVVEVLETTDPGHVRALLELAVKRSDALAFALVQVAVKFGRLDRDRGDRMGADRLVAALSDTPVFDEALRQVFHEDLAVEAAATLLGDVQAGAVDLVVAREPTPIGSGGRSGGREFLVPENADAGVLATVKERLHEQDVVLRCLHCREWRRETKVKRVPDEPTCPNCEATRIAALSPWAEDTERAIEAERRDTEQRELVQRAHRRANLVQSHGKQAVIALAARGVGPQTAARIIGRLRETEREFYRDLLEREREYARTEAFWD